jgi:hypothetical protein
MEIQRSMLRSYHAFPKSHPLISVTFSTPTGVYAHRPLREALGYAWRLCEAAAPTGCFRLCQ